MKNPMQVFRNKKIATIVLMVFGGIVLVGILVYQIYIQKPTYITVRIKGSPGNWWWVTPRPPDWLANSVHVGDKEFSATNKATAEVLAIDT